MDNTIKAGAVVVLLVASVVLGISVSSLRHVTENVNTPPVNEVVHEYGALVSPDIPYTYFCFGGVCQHAFSTESLNSASSTLCSLQSPPATTTLVSASLHVDSGIPYTIEDVSISRGTLITASTTIIAFDDSWTASEKGFLVATSAPLYLQDGVITPSSFINVKYSTTTAVNANFAPAGKCSAVFREI